MSGRSDLYGLRTTKLYMLENLRQKPKSVRAQYAFWGAFSLTAIIAAVWLVSLSVRFDDMAAVPEETKENAGAFSQFYKEATENLSNVFSTLKNPPADGETATTSTATATTTENAAASTEKKEEKMPGRPVQIVTSSSSASTSKSD